MKFRFQTRAVVSAEQQGLNVAAAKLRGLPAPKHQKRPPLAIVGGGPSVLSKVEKLKAFPGDIWVCGSAYLWAVQNGIKATYFNVDPLPEQAGYAAGATHAILSSNCDPSVFDAVPNVECFDLVESDAYSNHGVSAVTATPVLALEMGYTVVVYFGCESSFDETTHAYDHENTHAKAFGCCVRVGDTVFPTNPGLLLQAEMLAQVLRECPKVFREVSGGLLRALVVDPDYEIVAVNEAMSQDLTFFNENGTPIPNEQTAFPVIEMAL